MTSDKHRTRDCACLLSMRRMWFLFLLGRCKPTGGLLPETGSAAGGSAAPAAACAALPRLAKAHRAALDAAEKSNAALADPAEPGQPDSAADSHVASPARPATASQATPLSTPCCSPVCPQGLPSCALAPGRAAARIPQDTSFLKLVMASTVRKARDGVHGPEQMSLEHHRLRLASRRLA